MSGIAGIVNLDGAPVDRSLLEGIVRSSGRGSDAHTVTTYGHVALGHALLRTTHESNRERQPSTLDGQTWITADARVDGRADLIRELKASGRADLMGATDLKSATDDTLLLQAYHAWGERCVEYLIGDFAFVIWDCQRRRLFCARDQLGVKPFFYALAGTCLVFASELDCVRRHPEVPDELNDLAIADFLLWGQNQELDSTAFAAIHRLPPAHTLVCAADRPQIKRYWALSIPPETRYRRRADYTERFNELLGAAVADRLRTNRVAVLMSGGVDSPSVAAAARAELDRQQTSFDLRAHTVLWEYVTPSQERHYAQLAAEALDIPIHYHRTDRYLPFAGWDEPSWTTAEPSPEPLHQLNVALMGAVATHARVALTGWDGDLLCQRWLPTHFRSLLESLHLTRALAEGAWFLMAQRSLPPVGFRTRLRQRRQRRRRPTPGVPPWLRPELIARLDLRGRWEHVVARHRGVGRPALSDAIELLTGPALPALFDYDDPASTRSRVAVRYPLLDLRIVDYALSLPPIPWCVDKTIMRKAARSRLPRAICRRPKAPLTQDPVEVLLRRSDDRRTKDNLHSPVLGRYVTPDALPPLQPVAGSELFWPLLRVYGLDYWLRAGGAAE